MITCPSVYPKITPGRHGCPCRSRRFSLFVVAGQSGPAMLVYPKIASVAVSFQDIFIISCGWDGKLWSSHADFSANIHFSFFITTAFWYIRIP